MSSAKEWIDYYKDIGLDFDLAEKYITYAKPFLSKKLPVIFGFQHLADLIGIEPFVLAQMITNADKFYRTFSIPKRRGGSRRIDAPYPSLLYCQRWILDSLIYRIKPHNAAYGFVPGRNIITHAQKHCNKSFLLKLDLKDFFPSISESRIRALFLGLGYPNPIAHYLAALCSLDGVLPQGAASSPHLTNIICRRMDRRIGRYCRNRGWAYSRYADDIAISGDKINSSAIGVISYICEEEGFEVNYSKTILLGVEDRKIITGLDISSGYPRPTRKFRRELAKEVFYIYRFGMFSHAKKEKIRRPFYRESVVGKIAFWQSVEPNSPALKRVLKMAKQCGLLDEQHGPAAMLI